MCYLFILKPKHVTHTHTEFQPPRTVVLRSICLHQQHTENKGIMSLKLCNLKLKFSFVQIHILGKNQRRNKKMNLSCFRDQFEKNLTFHNFSLKPINMKNHLRYLYFLLCLLISDLNMTVRTCYEITYLLQFKEKK